MSEKPYKQRFLLPDKREITSVVMDLEDFCELAEKLRGIVMLNENCERTADVQIESIKAAKILPMMSRGTKTEDIFEQFEIETDLASFIVRGQGTHIAKGMGLIE